MKTVGSLWNKFWQDKHGRVVLWQTPNLPLIAWFAFMIVAYVLPDGPFRLAAKIIATIALLIWSLLEIMSGVSYFRRLIGFLVLALLISQFLFA